MSKHYINNRIELLEEHIRDISEKTTETSVSENSFFSYRHANRLFKSIKGESIHSFANKIRIQTAAEYLKYSSRSVFEIAVKVGYESAAAFIKAFKKLYGQTPSEFRQASQPDQALARSLEPGYTTRYLDEANIPLFKTAIHADSTFEDYYQHTKTAFSELNTGAEEWLLLWEEAPELCKVSEMRYFIGLHNREAAEGGNAFGKTDLKGWYALFDASSLEEFEYAIWHELAFFQLHLDGLELREAPYIEWFSKTSLHDVSTFFPYQIAIPIQIMS